MSDTHTISMNASKYGWKAADERAKKLDKDRSGYVQWLIEKDIDGMKFDGIFETVILLSIALLPLALIVSNFAFVFSSVFLVICIFAIFWRLKNAWKRRG